MSVVKRRRPPSTLVFESWAELTAEPRTLTESQARSEPGKQELGKRSKMVLVLIAEDSLDSRELLVDFLQFAGYRTAQAADGQEAIEKAQRFRPQIILMDLAMPILDGWEATRRLKKNPHTSRIPIVAVTAHALPDDERRAKEAGCDAFLTKPVNPEELLATVGRTLEKKGR